MHRMWGFTGFVLAAAAAVAGCGGGGGGGDGAVPVESGDVTLAVTDAPTDEVDTFEVDIVSFRFQKANGASVEVLPQTTRVDFAQLVTVSEVIAGASLPVGDYPRAFMTLDFDQASVRISGNAGAATLVDGQGRTLSGREELEIVFPDGGFTVGARRGYFAVVDFDLDQSLEVDAANNRVKVDTVLYAEIDPAQPKVTRVTGLAGDFDADGFDLDVRLGLGLVSRGVLDARTGAQTVFDLGGAPLTGAAGLAALEALGDGTLVATEGQVDPVRRTLQAARVVLLPQDLDEVAGVVVARTGGAGADATLTLRGVSVRRAAGSVTFNDTVTIRTAFASTQVARRGVASGALTTDAVNVGQRLLAYGRFSGGALDLTAPGAGFVRLVETAVSGALVSAPAGGRATVDLHRIGVRLASTFDFTVDGVVQADADAFDVEVGALGGSLAAGTPVIVRGFMRPVSATAAGEPDFAADSVTDRTAAGSLLRVLWLPGATAPLATRSGAEATIDVSQALSAVVDRGLVAPTALAANPTLSGGTGLFALRSGRRLTLYTRYDDFLDGLEAEVAAGRRTLHVRGLGRWDDATGRLTAARAVAVLY